MPIKPDAVCPNYPGHKDVEVAFSDPDDRTHHWHCKTDIPAGGLCHAEWVTPWRDDTFTDQYLKDVVEQFERSLEGARRAVIDALGELEHVAREDARRVRDTNVPAKHEYGYEARVRKVERCRRMVDDATEDLRVWKVEQQRQLSRRDTQAPASSQHYVDTGNYLDLGWDHAQEATS